MWGHLAARCPQARRDRNVSPEHAASGLFTKSSALTFGKTIMSFTRMRTGKRGEELAAAHLAEAGYRIVERNYRCIFGEIDIVAEEGETLVFVEVKSRRTEAYGDPQLAVGHEKQKKISRIAMNYLSEKRLRHRQARFDVVAVKLRPTGSRIELIRNAFELS
jgi:putative endonuclease